MGLFRSVRRGVRQLAESLRSPAGFIHSVSPLVPWVALLVTAAGICAGCQSANPIATHRLIEHQAMIDFSGLKPAEINAPLKVAAAAPRTWAQTGPIKTALYTHTQWRAPSGHTAVGAAYIHLPLPISAEMMLFFARHEYTKRSNDGRLIAQWTDELGRSWFEAENSKYHVQGYALAQGFEGWFVYLGYKTQDPPEMSEISTAARSVDTFVPLLGAMGKSTDPTVAPATAPALTP